MCSGTLVGVRWLFPTPGHLPYSGWELDRPGLAALTGSSALQDLAERLFKDDVDVDMLMVMSAVELHACGATMGKARKFVETRQATMWPRDDSGSKYPYHYQ